MSGRYAARKRRSVPMLLPHSGTSAGAGQVLDQERHRLLSGVLERDRRRLDRGQETTAGVHVSHDVVHAGERLGRLVDHEVGALRHDLEAVVGDQRRDLDDHVARRVETRHLEVHPRQHGPMVGRALRCAPMGAPIEIPLVRLDPDLPVPAYARSGDAGADLCAREDVTLAAGGGRAVVPTGLAIAIPPGHAGFVLPRSGLALKHGVTVLNSPGLIDAGYRDELRVVLVNTDPTTPYDDPPRRPDRAARHPACRGVHVHRRRRARGREPRRRVRPHRPLDLADDLLRVLVVALGEVARLAEDVLVRPLGERDLDDHLGPHPVRDLARRRRWRRIERALI